MPIIDSYSAELPGQVSAYLALSAVHTYRHARQVLTTGDAAVRLTDASFWIIKHGNPTGNIVATLYRADLVGGLWTPGPSIATSDPVSASSLNMPPWTAGEVHFVFSGAQRIKLDENTRYVIGITYASGNSSNYIAVTYDNESPSHHGHMSLFNKNGAFERWTQSDLNFTLSGDLYPIPDFTYSNVVGSPPLTVSFTDTSLNSPHAWSWLLGEGQWSTEQNPTVTYTEPGTYNVTLSATNTTGTKTLTRLKLVHVVRVLTLPTIELDTAITAPIVTVHDPPPPPDADWEALGKEDEKEYLVKVYDKTGNYLGIWDVTDTPQWTQRLLTAGTTTTVYLARSADTLTEFREPLEAEDGQIITTESGEPIEATYTTNRTVGEGTDVDIGHLVEIYVMYGGYEYLEAEDGQIITTESGEPIEVGVGAPLGRLVFSGEVVDYSSRYGHESGVIVTLQSHGFELGNEVIRSGQQTTVSYSSQSLESIVKSILDTNPGKVTYSNESIGTTGVTESMTFRLNSKLEGIKSVYNQTPDGWYWFVDVADSRLYLKPVNEGYDHIFVYREHIINLEVKRSKESLINDVYFVGGEVGGATVYRRYQDPDSIADWGRGLHIITDRRYTVPESMQRRAEKLINRYKNPIFTSPLKISSARYDIESIKLGQTVGFRNFGNYIDELPPLQIVNLTYTPTVVTIDLGELEERQIDKVAGLEDDLSNEQYATLPNEPS